MALDVQAAFQEAQAPLVLDFLGRLQPELLLMSPLTPGMASLLLLVATKVAAMTVDAPQWSFCGLDLETDLQPKTSVPPEPSAAQ